MDSPSSGDAGLGKELSLARMLDEAAAIETRLRQHSLELLEPTIRKQSAVDLKLKELKVTMDEQDAKLQALLNWQGVRETQDARLDSFVVELAKRDKELAELRAELADRFAAKDQDIAAVRTTVEKSAGETLHVNCALKTLGDVQTSVAEELQQLRRHVTGRLDLGHDKLAKLRDEFESQIMTMQNAVHMYRDQTFEVSFGADHIRKEVGRNQSKIAEIAQRLEDCWDTKASVRALEAVQDDLAETARRSADSLQQLRLQLDTLLDDVKRNFEVATKTMGTTTARELADMQRGFQEEAKRMEVVQRAFQSFELHNTDRLRRFEERVQHLLETSGKETNQLREDLDKLEEVQGINRRACDTELSIVRKSVKDLKEDRVSDGGGRAGKADVTHWLLESSLMSAALDSQDNVDRQAVALYGYKPAEGAVSLPELPSRSRAQKSPRAKRSPRAEHRAGDFVCSLDQRCLSCSGVSATVLAGFKMACLQYAPGPVMYEGKPYSRSDLIQMRSDLLEQARSQLRVSDQSLLF